MDEKQNIQWFPGHMKKTQRMLAENLRMIDCVCEIIDARIPYSSRNPDIDKLASGKPRLLVLNRCDQADPAATEKWKSFYRAGGINPLETDCKSGKGTAAFNKAVRTLLDDKIKKYSAKGQTGRKLRVMVVGIPNVGKSSFINRAVGKKVAVSEDRPGVTRGKQWISLDAGLELLDTPGILWPRFESAEVGENLAFTGAVRDAVVDTEALAAKLMAKLSAMYPGLLEARYRIIVSSEMTGYELLEHAAQKRGFKISGGDADTLRMANIVLDEFRAGKLGRITLELPEAVCD